MTIDICSCNSYVENDKLIHAIGCEQTIIGLSLTEARTLCSNYIIHVAGTPKTADMNMNRIHVTVDNNYVITDIVKRG